MWNGKRKDKGNVRKAKKGERNGNPSNTLYHICHNFKLVGRIVIEYVIDFDGLYSGGSHTEHSRST